MWCSNFRSSDQPSLPPLPVRRERGRGEDRFSYTHAMLVHIKLNKLCADFIRRKVSSGEYDDASHVVNAALATLMDQPELHFEPGELQRLIAEGEESGKKHGWIDADEALRERRQRRASVANKQNARRSGCAGQSLDYDALMPADISQPSGELVFLDRWNVRHSRTYFPRCSFSLRLRLCSASHTPPPALPSMV